MDNSVAKNIAKKDKRRISPVQLHRYKKSLDKDTNKESNKEENLDISLLSDYLEEIESKIEYNSNNNEDLYSQILELRNRIEKIEQFIVKIKIN